MHHIEIPKGTQKVALVLVILLCMALLGFAGFVFWH